MRCACPQCGAFMEHAETNASCVCPQCLARCSACLGTGTVWSREDLMRLRDQPDPEQRILDREWEDASERPHPEDRYV